MSHRQYPSAPRSLRGRGFLAACAAATAFASDLLFHDQPLGANLAAFGLVLLGLVVLVRHRPRRLTSRARRLVYAMIGLVGISLVEPGVIACALFVLALWTLAIGATAPWPRCVVSWLREMFRLPAELVTRAFADLRLAERWRRRHPGVGSRRSSLAAWAIPSCLAFLFVVLFWIANPVIARWMREAYDVVSAEISALCEQADFARALLWGSTALFAWATLRSRRRARAVAGVGSPVEERTAPRLAVVADESFISRCLGLFNVVFAVQTSLDLAYLVGGAKLPEGMTFAAYAHRGAYPLIAAALLAGVFALWAFPARASERGAWPRRLITLWIGQCVILVGTAGWRLWLYVGEYSLTRWRLATIVWLVLVSFGLTSLIVRIVSRRDNIALLSWNLRASIAVLALCTLPDIDGFIARYNVAHCRELGADAQPIDIEYLQSLGAASIAPLAFLAERTTSNSVRSEALATRAALARQLEASLDDWRGWSLRRAFIARESAAPSPVQ